MTSHATSAVHTATSQKHREAHALGPTAKGSARAQAARGRASAARRRTPPGPRRRRPPAAAAAAYAINRRVAGRLDGICEAGSGERRDPTRTPTPTRRRAGRRSGRSAPRRWHRSSAERGPDDAEQRDRLMRHGGAESAPQTRYRHVQPGRRAPTRRRACAMHTAMGGRQGREAGADRPSATGEMWGKNISYFRIIASTSRGVSTCCRLKCVCMCSCAPKRRVDDPENTAANGYFIMPDRPAAAASGRRKSI